MLKHILYIVTLFLIVSCVNKKNRAITSDKDSTQTLNDSTEKEIVVTDIYNGELGRDIYYDTEDEPNKLFIRDNNYQFNILDRTDDNRWIMVEKSPVIVDSGRVETETILLNIPYGEVNVKSYDLDLNPIVHGFKKYNGINYVIASKDNENKDVLVPLSSLLPAIELKFDESDNFFSLGKYEKLVNNGEYLYATPSFYVSEGSIYLLNASKFRILVFGSDGKFIRKISYPDKLKDGRVNVIDDLCVGKGVIYLLSTSDKSIYILDSETEDVISVISGDDTKNKCFRNVSSIKLNYKGQLLIPDTWDNTLYIYERTQPVVYSLISSLPYNLSNQLFEDLKGNSYKVIEDSSRICISKISGNNVGCYNYKLKHGNINILGFDTDANIYFKTSENNELGAQYVEASYLAVMNQKGDILNSIRVDSWSGGKIINSDIVDELGNVYTFSYLCGESPDDPPLGITIRKRMLLTPMLQP